MKSLLTLLSVLGFFILPGFGQQRYIDAVFDSVIITSDVKYQVNVSILAGSPVLDSFYVDIYEPAGDSLAERPLVLFCGGSEFLPPIFNGTPFGTKTDSANVEIGKRLARMGYVVAVFEYRLGYAPSPFPWSDRGDLTRTFYRGIQDVRTLIRFFRRNAAESGNSYGVDVNKIAVGGSSTGGNIALGAAYLDKIEEIQLPKFNDLLSTAIVPEFMGNLEGSDTTYLPDSLGNPSNRLLNIGNHAGYSSDFRMVFSLGGALADSSWLENGDMPFVGFHSTNDLYTPYKIGHVSAPIFGFISLVDAAGSHTCAMRSNGFGNNDVFASLNLNDNISQAANVDNDGYEGLFPFIIPDVTGDSQCITSMPFPPAKREPNNAPWAWWDEDKFISIWDSTGGQPGNPSSGSEANCALQLRLSPDPVAARTYIDTIMAYLGPRMATVLEIQITNLDNNFSKPKIQVFPNPASDRIYIRSEDASNPILAIQLIDINGRALSEGSNISHTEHTIVFPLYPSGIYFLQIKTLKGVIIEKIILE